MGMSVDEKLEACAAMRTKGNDWFKKKDYERALRRYTKALEFVKDDWDFKTDEEKQKAKEAKLPCLLNRAQCHLSNNDATSAKTDSKDALEIDGTSLKALFRHGSACLSLDEWDTACESFHAILKI